MGFFNIATKSDHKQDKANIIISYGCKLCPAKNKAHFAEPIGGNTPLVYVLSSVPELAYLKNGSMGGIQHFIKNRLRSTFITFDQGNDFRFNSVVRCIPTNEKSYDLAMKCCRDSIIKDIEETKPMVILGLGEDPLKFLLDEGHISLWRGRMIPVRVGTHTAWYFPLLDPNISILELPDWKTKETKLIYDFDLRRVNDFLLNSYTEPIIYNGAPDGIEIVLGKSLEDIKRIKDKLSYFKSKPKVGLDIETHGLRPWASTSKFLSIAIGTWDEVIAFPIEHPGASQAYLQNKKEVLSLLQDFLVNSGTKICHNLKFELIWLNHFFGQKTLRSSKWTDTMAQAYLLDERSLKSKGKVIKGMYSLDTLSKIHFGFSLKSVSDISRDNLINDPIEKVLLYNGLDSKYTYKLEEAQSPYIVEELVQLREHHDKIALTVALTETKGIPVDEQTRYDFEKYYKIKLAFVDASIKALPEVKKYEKLYGSFDYASSIKLIKMFKDILNLSQVKGTESGGFSTDDEVLQIYAKKGIRLASLIADFREISKLQSTYIIGLKKSIEEDGRLRTNFNTMFTTTGRFSSDDPNMQNFPKHQNGSVRSIIHVPTTEWLVAIDYGQIEARCIAMASKDKKFCNAVWDDYDVHREWAINAIKKYPKVVGINSIEEATEDIIKKLRGKIKNQLVFPWFYLASPKSVGVALGIPEVEILSLYDDFWKDFSGARKWQDVTQSFYTKHGYVKSLTGRRRRGIINKNMIVNSPIQGTASDIVTDAMNRLSEFSYLLDKPQYQPVLNIHDDLTTIISNDTLEEDIEFMAKEMTKPVFDFINVPLSVEVSIGKDWYNLKELARFNSVDFGWMKKEDYVNNFVS